MQIPILLPNIFDYPFTYETDLNLKIGDYVLVPFGKSEITGVVWNEFEKKTKKKFLIKKVIKKLEVPPLKKQVIEFLNWFSDYNMVPRGMCLKLVLQSNKAIEKIEKKNFEKFNFQEKKEIFELSNDQKICLKKMNDDSHKFRVHVLQGTTGSGKTIVYFSALKKKLIKDFKDLFCSRKLV